ncbi:MAG: DNA/RNA non-specific endonuclease, partial [Bacteroidaceae bacterium]|nr:DNA/RNA non-specific endonuclease [Bacteroidaceae bacterium]
MENRFMYCTLARMLTAGAMCLAIASCGDDLPGAPEGGQTVANENANRSAVPEASRIEMPRLKGGAYTQFIVKKARLRDNGVEEFVNFCMEYDQTKKASRWTAFRWDIDNVYDSNCGRTGNFAADTDVPVQYRLGLGTYRGYKRGHMLA